MKTVLIILGIIVAIGLIGTLVIIILDRQVRGAVIQGIDLSRVPDGLYTGHFKSGRWKNEVEVTVEDHHIVSIKNTNTLPDKRAQEIIDQAIEEMIKGQSIAIDAISGASLNTKSFQLAVKNALTKGD